PRQAGRVRPFRRSGFSLTPARWIGSELASSPTDAARAGLALPTLRSGRGASRPSAAEPFPGAERTVTESKCAVKRCEFSMPPLPFLRPIALGHPDSSIEEGDVSHGLRLALGVHQHAVPAMQDDRLVVGMADPPPDVDAGVSTHGLPAPPLRSGVG